LNILEILKKKGLCNFLTGGKTNMREKLHMYTCMFIFDKINVNYKLREFANTCRLHNRPLIGTLLSEGTKSLITNIF